YAEDQRRWLIEECQRLLLILADIESRPEPGRPVGDRHELDDRALRYLDLAGSLGRPSRAYFLRRSECLRRRGGQEAADPARAEAARVAPGGAADSFLIGYDHYRHGDFKGALRTFRDTLSQAPADFWAHYFSAVCWLNLDRPGEAEASLTAALAFREDFAW